MRHGASRHLFLHPRTSRLDTHPSDPEISRINHSIIVEPLFLSFLSIYPLSLFDRFQAWLALSHRTRTYASYDQH